MAQRYGFFDAVVTGGVPDRQYTAADWSRVHNRLWAGEGVDKNYQAAMIVTETSPPSMGVRVDLGWAWVQGYWLEVHTAAEVVALSPSHPTLPRIDLIVARLDRNAAQRKTYLAKIDGTPSATPAAPLPITTDPYIYDIPLAQVAVGAGVTTVTNVSITDRRSVVGAGVVPDGVATNPGVAFQGNIRTGLFRATGTLGSIRATINGTFYHYWGTDGYAYAMGGGPAGGFSFQTYGQAWALSGADGGFLPIYLVNGAAPGTATKQAILGLGTAASQALGGSGDLNVYTAGTGAGGVLIGTSGLRRYGVTAGGVHNWGTGAFAGAAQFNFFQSANTAAGGVRIYNVATTGYLDIYINASGVSAFNNSGASNSLWVNPSTGYLSLGNSSNSTARLTLVQGTNANTEGWVVIYGGGLGRGYVDTDGAFILASATTAVRLNHATSMFGPNDDNTIALGVSSKRWLSGHIGGVILDTSATYPAADISRNLGAPGLRWARGYFNDLSISAGISSGAISISQPSGAITAGISFLWGGGQSFMAQDAIGDFIIQGPGPAVFQFGVQYNTTCLAPKTTGGGSLGDTNRRWSSVWTSGVVNAATGVFSGAISAVTSAFTGVTTFNQIRATADNTYDNGDLSQRWRYGHFGSGIGVGIGSTPAYMIQLGSDSAAKPSTNTWTVVSDIRVKHEDSVHDYEAGLEQILALRPVHYRTNGAWTTEDMGENDPYLIGFVADEAQKISPELVGSVRAKLNPDDKRVSNIKTVNTHALPFMLINSVKTLNDRLEAQDAEIARLRALVEGRGN